MSVAYTPKRWSIWSRLLLLVIALFLITEVFLRSYLGFCDAVLMRADPHYEYIPQPNQDRCRYGHHIQYNSLSMRSEEPDSSAVLILGCGDSVINGGMMTDQDSLATTILSDRLSKTLGRKVQFLNIAAGSWGPDNCVAYLQHTPLPKPQAIVLFASSHDAHDNMVFSGVVGRMKHFPDEQYPLAVLELVDRYLLPKLLRPKKDADEELGISKGGHGFNPGFDGIVRYAEARGIPLVLYMHAERSEIKVGNYNAQGQAILAFAEQAGLHVLKDLDHHVSVDELRDNIHPTDRGQRTIATNILKDIVSHPAAYGSAP